MSDSTRARHDLEDIEQVMRELLHTTKGRKFVSHILLLCGIKRLSFTGDAMSSAFNEGQRSIGLALDALAYKATPDKYAEMLKENTIYDRSVSRPRRDTDPG